MDVLLASQEVQLVHEPSVAEEVQVEGPVSQLVVVSALVAVPLAEPVVVPKMVVQQLVAVPLVGFVEVASVVSQQLAAVHLVDTAEVVQQPVVVRPVESLEVVLALPP